MENFKDLLADAIFHSRIRVTFDFFIEPGEYQSSQGKITKRLRENLEQFFESYSLKPDFLLIKNERNDDDFKNRIDKKDKKIDEFTDYEKGEFISNL